MTPDPVFRLVVLVVLATAFSISATYRKKARSSETIERRKEGSLALFFRMALGLSLLAVLLLNIVYPRALTWSKIDVPLPIRITGCVLAALCIPLLLWVFGSIGSNISETVLTKQSHQLVTHGPYKWVRHPLYSSSLLMLYSFSLILGDWLILLYSLAGTIAFRFLVIPAEEQKLVEAFGDEYQDYRRRTGALVPRLKAFKSTAQ